MSASRRICDGVYEPAEDSLIVAKVAEAVSVGARVACDLGCGAGLVAFSMSSKCEYVVAVDLDFRAVSCAKDRLPLDVWNVDFVCADALSAIRPSSLDVVATNPPYLESLDGDLRWDGGTWGLEVPLKFARSSARALREGGVLVILVSSLSPLRVFRECLVAYGYSLAYTSCVPVGLMESLCLFIARKGARGSNR